MTTIKDIAKLANVSLGTVSNVLNKKGNVSLEKIHAVEKAASELGYSINASAKSLKKGTNKEIVFILPSLKIDKNLDLYTSVQESLSRLNYDISLYITNDVMGKELEIINKIKMNKIAFYIVKSCLKDIDIYKEVNSPVIFIDRSDIEKYEKNDFIFVGFDYHKAALEIFQYISNKKYFNIAYFTSSRQYKNNSEFIKGLRESNEENINIDLYTSDINFSLKKSFEILNTNYDLIIASDNERSESIISASKFLNKEIPNIISIDSYKKYSNNYYQSYEMNYHYLGSFVSNIIENYETGYEKYNILYVQRLNLKTDYIKKSKKRKIKILSIISPTTVALKNIIKSFTLQSGIEVEITQLPYEELHTHATTMSKDFYYDLIRIDVAKLNLIGKEIYQPLDKNVDIDEIIKYINNDNLAVYTKINENIYTLPFDPSVQILLYRKDLFENVIIKRMYYEKYKEHLSIPLNFKEFNKISNFFKNNSDKINIKYGSTMTYGSPIVAACDFMPRLLSNLDSNNLDDKYGKINNVLLKESFEDYLNNLNNSNKVNNKWWSESIEEFAKGNSAMSIVFSNYAYDISNSKISNVAGMVGVADVPGKKPLLGGGVIGISKFSDKIEECIEFLKWFYSSDVNYVLTLLGGSSINYSQLEHYNLKYQYPWISIINKSFKYGTREYFANEKKIDLIKFESIIGNTLRNLINGYISLDEAVKFIEASYSNILKS